MPAIFITSSTGDVAEELKTYQEREFAGWVRAYSRTLRAQAGSEGVESQDLADRARRELAESASLAAECYAGK